MRAALPAVVFFTAAAAAVGAESGSWEIRAIPGIPFSSELPIGGVVRVRDVTNLMLPDGAKTWGKDITLQEWEDGWLDMIRISYTEGWAPGFSEGWDALPPKKRRTWGTPTVKRWRGLKTYEFGFNDLGRSDDRTVQLWYVIPMGRRKYFALHLACRTSSFDRYAPYYMRIRDSLTPAAAR